MKNGIWNSIKEVAGECRLVLKKRSPWGAALHNWHDLFLSISLISFCKSTFQEVPLPGTEENCQVLHEEMRRLVLKKLFQRTRLLSGRHLFVGLIFGHCSLYLKSVYFCEVASRCERHCVLKNYISYFWRSRCSSRRFLFCKVHYEYTFKSTTSSWVFSSGHDLFF